MADPSKSAYPAPPPYSPDFGGQEQLPYYQPTQAYPGYQIQPAGTYPVGAVLQTAPGGISYIVPGTTQQMSNGQQVIVLQQAAVVRHHTPGGKVCSRRMKTPYGPLRLLQLLMSIAQFAIICTLLAYDDYWYYWLWLLVLPLCSFSTSSNQLTRHYNITWGYGGGSDIAFAILYIVQAGSIAGIYFGFDYVWYWQVSYMNIIYTALAFDGVLSLLYWITGCSAACCKCLNHNMPEPGWH